MKEGILNTPAAPPPAPPGAVTPIEMPDRSLGGVTPPEAAVSGELKQETQEVAREAKNPARTAFGVTRESRIPMNTPDRKLEVPEIEGFHLHWFLEHNVPKAVKAGYEFVVPAEAGTNDLSVGGRTAGATSDDVAGSRVTVIAGTDIRNEPVQLVLMKIWLEWYHDDQKRVAKRNKEILVQIFQRKLAIREAGEQEDDYSKRYTREAVIDMSQGRFRKSG